MGHRVAQKIYTCDICGITPEDGEYLWEMCGQHWCQACCENEQTEDENETLTSTHEGA